MICSPETHVHTKPNFSDPTRPICAHYFVPKLTTGRWEVATELTVVCWCSFMFFDHSNSHALWRLFQLFVFCLSTVAILSTVSLTEHKWNLFPMHTQIWVVHFHFFQLTFSWGFLPFELLLFLSPNFTIHPTSAPSTQD